MINFWYFSFTTIFVYFESLLLLLLLITSEKSKSTHYISRIVDQTIRDIKWLCQFIRIEIEFVAKQSPFSRSNSCSFNQPLLFITCLYFDCSSDIRAEEEIVAYNTTTGIAILHLFIVPENGRLQRTVNRWSVMAVFHGLEGDSCYHYIIFFGRKHDADKFGNSIWQIFFNFFATKHKKQKILQLFTFKLQALWFI